MINIPGRPAAVVLTALAAFGCSDSADNELRQGAEKVVPVQVVEVTVDSVSPTLTYTGTVEPWAEAALGSEIPGRLEVLYGDVGDTVEAGFLIAKLGSEALIQARANFDAMEKEWSRVKYLHQAGTYTQQTYDQTQAAFEAAKAIYEKTLASTQLRAPFSGVITEKYLDVGEVFTLYPGSAGSPAIVKLMMLDTVKARISVTESEYPRLLVGQTARLVLDSYRDTEFTGRVSLVAPTLDTRTRTASVEVQFTNREGLIRPGMFGRVSIALEVLTALTVNRDALVREGGTGLFYAYRIENGRAMRADLTRGDDFGGRVEIIRGLRAGDTVITVGKMNVRSGTAVTVVGPEVSR